jgi:hypothetical protein
MISDILSEGVTDLDHYLNCPTFDDVHERELRDRIIRLRNEAEYLKCLLDVPPGARLPSEVVLLERIDAQRSLRVEDRCYVLASETEDLGGSLQRAPKPNGRACCRQTVACG